MAEDNQVTEFMGSVKARLDGIDRSLSTIEKTIAGNGKDGLAERISKNETRLIETTKDLDRLVDTVDVLVRTNGVLASTVEDLRATVLEHVKNETAHSLPKKVQDHLDDYESHLPQGLMSRKNITIVFFIVSLISLSWVYGGPVLELLKKFAGF